jgi:TrmH family RNA methyltransferase
MQIESAQNPLIIKLASLKTKKGREAEGLILVEGPHPIEEAQAAGLELVHLFVRQGTPPPCPLPPGLTPTTVTEHIMKKLASTDSPPPVIAAARPPSLSPESVLNLPVPLFLVLDGLQDPGNMGTLIRSAVAFGVSAVLLTPGTVDPMSPKVIRASAGLVFALPVVAWAEPTEKLLETLQTKNVSVYGTSGHPEQAQDFRSVPYQGATALLLGQEGGGLRSETLGRVSTTITIPMHPRVESLNVGISGSIILAEADRQRRTAEAEGVPG